MGCREKIILTAEMIWLWKIIGISKLQKIRNDYIISCPSKAAGQRLSEKTPPMGFGHVERISDHRIPDNTLHASFERKTNK